MLKRPTAFPHAASGEPAVRGSLKAVALPSEHGGWGLTLEPVALGLLAAPGWAGLGLGVSALAAFLVRHPLRLWHSDVRKGKRYRRTALALLVALGYGCVGVLGFVLAAAQAQGPFVWPLVLAVPLALLQFSYDARGRGRNLVPEFSGATAMSSVVAAIALAGGLPWTTAAGLWLVLAMRALGALSYARAQVMRARGVPVNPAPAYAAEVAATGVLAVAALAGLSPWMSVAGMGLLVVFSAYTFALPPVPARVVGWTQVAFGLLMVILTALGVRVGL
ncbi:MAG: YwiC-like family protein [Armatimonadota bacterium]|nr:YwiC-like family protein [Armatimonadota bacterium]